jgi:hypothetical protein
VKGLAAAALAGALAGAGAAASAQTPPGEERSTTTKLLESAAELVQGEGPVKQLSLHLVGFHPLKDDPRHQMEAHHFCDQVNEEFAQCVLFDGHEDDARLNGIEYIISENLFESLPAGEKRYWHPHNYEILSGQLVAPGIPDAAEHEAMARKMNSYGKTWHVWKTGMPGEAGDALPHGEPHLAWSFNRDGEARPDLLSARDEKLGVSTGDKKEGRADLVAQAHPQCGVDALNGRFAGATTPIDGVTARRQGCPPEGGAPTTEGAAGEDAPAPH